MVIFLWLFWSFPYLHTLLFLSCLLYNRQFLLPLKQTWENDKNTTVIIHGESCGFNKMKSLSHWMDKHGSSVPEVFAVNHLSLQWYQFAPPLTLLSTTNFYICRYLKGSISVSELKQPIWENIKDIYNMFKWKSAEGGRPHAKCHFQTLMLKVISPLNILYIHVNKIVSFNLFNLKKS